MGGYGCRLRSRGEGIVSSNGGGIGPAVLGSGYDGDDADEGVLMDERSLIVLLRRTELLPLDRLLSGRYSRVRTPLPSATVTPPAGVRSVEGVISTNWAPRASRRTTCLQRLRPEARSQRVVVSTVSRRPSE